MQCYLRKSLVLRVDQTVRVDLHCAQSIHRDRCSPMDSSARTFPGRGPHGPQQPGGACQIASSSLPCGKRPRQTHGGFQVPGTWASRYTRYLPTYVRVPKRAEEGPHSRHPWKQGANVAALRDVGRCTSYGSLLHAGDSFIVGLTLVLYLPFPPSTCEYPTYGSTLSVNRVGVDSIDCVRW